MLTAQTLNRVSCAYGRGYRDGYNGNSNNAMVAAGTFANFDYAEGFKAGANDRRHDDKIISK